MKIDATDFILVCLMLVIACGLTIYSGVQMKEIQVRENVAYGKGYNDCQREVKALLNKWPEIRFIQIRDSL